MSTTAAATTTRSAPHLLKLLGVVFAFTAAIIWFDPKSGLITIGLLAAAVPIWLLTARFRNVAPAA
jgi:hypothetical protein